MNFAFHCSLLLILSGLIVVNGVAQTTANTNLLQESQHLKILIAGESWMSHSVHVKGFDSFTTDTYEEGVKWLRAALERAGHKVYFMPNHLVSKEFPTTAAFASDCGPHWGPPEYLNWKYHDQFWAQLVKWLSKR